MSSNQTPSDKPAIVLTEQKYTLQQVRQPLEKLSRADASNVQEIVASQIELMAVYHNQVIDQARRSFNWAIIAGGIGLSFFLAAVSFILFQQSQNGAMISLISGALIEFISAINFYLYGKTSSQLSDFQSRLDTTQRFLLANSICEGLKKNAKEQARLDLVRVISGSNAGNDKSLTNTSVVEEKHE